MCLRYKTNDLYIRYEPKIGDGTLFVFNKESGDIFEGDQYTYWVLSLIDGERDVTDIIRNLVSEHNLKNTNTLKTTVVELLAMLHDIGLISPVSA